jgi:hypothetical protein
MKLQTRVCNGKTFKIYNYLDITITTKGYKMQNKNIEKITIMEDSTRNPLKNKSVNRKNR